MRQNRLRDAMLLRAAGLLLVFVFLQVGRAAPEKPSASGNHHFVFRDVGDEVGLYPDIAGIRGHAAGWGDVDGDGFLDLYVGAFHNQGSKPNLFFRNIGGKFKLDEQTNLRISTRPTAALFADFQNNGRLDLYVSSMPTQAGSKRANKDGGLLRGCSLFRNDGSGRFTNVSEGNGACPSAFGGRSATLLDFDGDGLLDLLVGEDPHPGYNGSPTRSTRLFHNKGNLQFEDVTQIAGIPAGIPGYGVAAADVNGDGWPDIFIAANSGGNVLLLNDGHGHFHECPRSRETFAWKGAGGDNMICGVCIADVNGDGLPDILIGQHYKQPWESPVANRLYLNRGVKDGVPTFEDVTEKVGLMPLPMKGPHIEIQDFDNDGLPDIYISIVKFIDGKPYPLIYRNLGNHDGLPHFHEDVLGLDKIPPEKNRAARPFQGAQDELTYMAPGPSGDFDNDGRLDLFLPTFAPQQRSLLLRNETPGGNWLDVRVEGSNGVNRMGIGCKVRIYRAGKLGDSTALLGWREIATGYGYASAQPAIAHFGLGKTERVDVEVILPHGKGTMIRKDVKANQKLTVK